MRTGTITYKIPCSWSKVHTFGGVGQKSERKHCRYRWHHVVQYQQCMVIAREKGVKLLRLGCASSVQGIRASVERVLVDAPKGVINIAESSWTYTHTPPECCFSNRGSEYRVVHRLKLHLCVCSTPTVSIMSTLLLPYVTQDKTPPGLI